MSAPKRIQLRRTKGWHKPEGSVVVSRPSKWGNPYRVHDKCSPAQAVSQYRDLIHRIASSDTECWHSDGLSPWDRHIVRHIQESLRGHGLACWCPLDQPCHADVLLEIANGERA